MMKRLLVLALPLAPLAVFAVEPADLVLRHGNIYTGSPAAPRAEAVAVRDGRILWVGSDADAESFAKGAKRVIDLAGRRCSTLMRTTPQAAC